MDEEKATQIAQKKKRKMLHRLICSSDTFLMPLGLSLLDDLLSFMCAHPLPLAYLLFFSTHISTLLSFLLPLLLTTLLSLATFPHLGDHPPDHLGSTCRLLVGATLLPRQQESDPDLVGALGFLSPIFLELETCVDLTKKASLEQRTPQGQEDDGSPAAAEAKGAVPISGMLRWEEFEAIGKLYTALTHEMGECPLKLAIDNLKMKQPPKQSSGGVDPLQVVEEGGGKEEPLEGWETPVSELDEFYDESPTSIIRGGGQPAWVDAKGSGLERFGSMKKDKEWRRTLACKLYEERWVKGGEVEDEEGMDVLWEEHEDRNTMSKSNEGDDHDGERSRTKRMVAMAKGNRSRKSKHVDRIVQQRATVLKRAEEEEGEGYDDDHDDILEEEGGDVVGPFCCLQALRFSTKRMRLGMGKYQVKNLSRMSKAIKGGLNLIRSSSRRSRGA